MAESETDVCFDSLPNDGLLGVVSRAQDSVLAASDAPIGVLAIELLERSEGAYRVASPADLAIGIEVAYAEHQGAGVIERLEVHVARELAGPPDAGLVKAVLADHGGTEFTSVCLSRPEGGEICDVTLHFSSRLKILAELTALIEPELTPAEIDAAAAVLAELQITAKRRDATFSVPRRALRGGMSTESQTRAFERAVQKHLDIELYASTLPVSRAVRLAARSGESRWLFALALSRRLSPESKSAARDAVALRDFVGSRFSFDFGGHRWRVENAHGSRTEHRPHGPLGEHRALQWSLNWGARKG